MAKDQEEQATWVAINPSTYPSVLKINAQFHVDEDDVDTWVEARDPLGGSHMMTESNLARLYVREGELPTPEPMPEPVVSDTVTEPDLSVYDDERLVSKFDKMPDPEIEEILVEEEVLLEADEPELVAESELEEELVEEPAVEPEAEPAPLADTEEDPAE